MELKEFKQFFLFVSLKSDDSDDGVEWQETGTESSTESVGLQYLYIQMEYCEKSTLRNLIDEGLHQDKDRVWRLFREIVEGLAHIHTQVILTLKELRNFKSWSFLIRFNLLHPQPSLSLDGLLVSLWCFSVPINHYCQVSFNLKVSFYIAKITQNAMIELLSTEQVVWWHVQCNFHLQNLSWT